MTFSAAHAQSQSWPARPIRLVVPFAPGGSTDVLARVLGQKLGEKLGQPFLIDNRAGAGGTIGTAIAAKSNSDGYTLVLGTTSTLAINESLYPRLAYDVARDLAPIVLLAKGPFVLMSTPGLPVTSLKELIAYAKARPGQLSIASSGNGTSVHLSAELFKMVAQLPDIVHIPFKGGGPAGVALMAGEVQLMINDLPPAIGPIPSGPTTASSRVMGRSPSDTAASHQRGAPPRSTIMSSTWQPSTHKSSPPPRASSLPRPRISSTRPILPSSIRSRAAA